MLTLLLATTLTATPTLAIAYFDADKPELDPIRRGFTEMLITDFAQLSSVRVLERGKIDLVFDELKLWKTPLVDAATVQKLGKRLAVNYLLVGDVNQISDRLFVSARVIEVKTGNIVAARNVDGERALIFAMEKDIAQLLVDALELKLSVSERSKLRKAHGKSYDEFLEYAKGLAALDRGDAAGAKKHFDNSKGDPALRAIAYDLAIATHYGAMLTDEEDADFDEQFRALDPKSKTLGDTVMYLAHSQYGGMMDPRKMENLILLAEWVVDRRISPMGGSGNAVAAEPSMLIVLESLFRADPKLAHLWPRLYEYLLRKYPNDAYSAESATRAMKLGWPVSREFPGPMANHEAMKRLLTKIAAQVKR